MTRSSGERWRARRFASIVASGWRVLPAAIFLAEIAAFGIIIAAQGWRSRIPNLDTIPSIAGAAQFLHEGTVPDRGVLSSFLSYVPPGATWVAVPGVALSSDPRLAVLPGAAMLYIGTLVGVWLLARRYFGLPCAALAVLVYGLSEVGVRYAAFIGPRGHPFFFVWMVFLACEWVRRRDARFLAASVAMWGTGMYLFLELAPAIFILPVLWLWARPPVGVRSLTVAAVALMVLWFPYLRFEHARGFVDLQSQVLRQPLPTDAVAVALCDQTLMFRGVGSARGGDDPDTGRAVRLTATLGRRLLSVGRGLLANFHGAVPGADVLVLVLVLGGLVLFWRPPHHPLPAPPDGRWVFVLAIGAMVAAAGANEFMLLRLLRPSGTFTSYTTESIRAAQALLALAGVGLLLRASLARALNSLKESIDTRSPESRTVLLCLGVSWALCLAVVEHGRHERLTFLWPVQAVVLAACLTAGSTSQRWAGRLWGGARIALAAALIGGPIWGAVASAQGVGWSGRDASEVVFARRAADRIRTARGSAVAIGAHVFPARTWGARFARTDRQYRFGAELDQLFSGMFGIVNTNRCPEGVSDSDDYRVVEAPPASDDVREYVDSPLDPSFHLVETYSRYRLFERP